MNPDLRANFPSGNEQPQGKGWLKRIGNSYLWNRDVLDAFRDNTDKHLLGLVEA